MARDGNQVRTGERQSNQRRTCEALRERLKPCTGEEERGMKYYDEKRQLLKDEKIVEALREAADSYGNGEIAEVRDTLREIVAAIDEFTADFEV